MDQIQIKTPKLACLGFMVLSRRNADYFGSCEQVVIIFVGPTMGEYKNFQRTFSDIQQQIREIKKIAGIENEEQKRNRARQAKDRSGPKGREERGGSTSG
jgi:hypothetical protein